MKDLINGFWLKESFEDGSVQIRQVFYKQYGRAKSNAERILINELVRKVDILKIDENGRETIISSILRGRASEATVNAHNAQVLGNFFGGLKTE